MISAKSKTSHIKTVFTYSHANTPLSQSERAYYLSYFIKCSGTYYIASGTILVINIRSIGPITCFVLSARKHFKTSLNIKSPHVRESTKLLFFSLGRGGGRGGAKESRNPGIWNPKSHGRLKWGIQVPVTKIWNQVQSTWNSESAEWNPEYKTALDPLPNGINRRSYQP